MPNRSENARPSGSNPYAVPEHADEPLVLLDGPARPGRPGTCLRSSWPESPPTGRRKIPGLRSRSLRDTRLLASVLRAWVRW